MNQPRCLCSLKSYEQIFLFETCISIVSVEKNIVLFLGNKRSFYERVLHWIYNATYSMSKDLWMADNRQKNFLIYKIISLYLMWNEFGPILTNEYIFLDFCGRSIDDQGILLQETSKELFLYWLARMETTSMCLGLIRLLVLSFFFPGLDFFGWKDASLWYIVWAKRERSRDHLVILFLFELSRFSKLNNLVATGQRNYGASENIDYDQLYQGVIKQP